MTEGRGRSRQLPGINPGSSRDLPTALKALSPADPMRVILEALAGERDPALLAAVTRRVYREIFTPGDGAP